MTQNNDITYSDNRPYLQIPAPPYGDPEMYERMKEEEARKEEELRSQNSGSVIIIDM